MSAEGGEKTQKMAVCQALGGAQGAKISELIFLNK
jgi:hypothetical protein